YRLMSRAFLSSVMFPSISSSYAFFFFHDPPPPDIYTLSLHDALPIHRDGLGSRGLLLRVEAARFRAVSAVAHVAPPARVVLAAVEEDPLAGGRGTLFYAIPLDGRKQIDRGPRDLPERALELVTIRRKGPAEAVAVVDEARPCRARRRGVADQFQIFVARDLP